MQTHLRFYLPAPDSKILEGKNQTQAPPAAKQSMSHNGEVDEFLRIRTFTKRRLSRAIPNKLEKKMKEQETQKLKNPCYFLSNEEAFAIWRRRAPAEVGERNSGISPAQSPRRDPFTPGMPLAAGQEFPRGLLFSHPQKGDPATSFHCGLGERAKRLSAPRFYRNPPLMARNFLLL